MSKYKNNKKNSSLREIRNQLGLSLEKAAEGIGIHYQTLRRLEHSENYPEKITQEKIFDFYRRKGIFIFEEDVFPKKQTTQKVKLIPFDEENMCFTKSIEKVIEEKDFQRYVNNLLLKLSEREREVVKKRFGFYGKKMTRENIGKEMGVCGERIRQIELRALRKLRNPKNIRKFRELY